MWKKILIGLVVLVVLFVGIAFVLPGSFDVSRSVDIKADADDVYEYVGDLKKWQEWSVWNKAAYPNMKSTYSGEKEGKGATWAWEDPSGNGSLSITTGDEDKGITYDLSFEGMGTSKGSVMFVEADKMVKVTMRLTGTFSMNPIERWMGLMMDSMMGGEFQKCLDNLKTVVEKK